MIRETSLEAYMDLLPQLGERQQKVLDGFKKYGSHTDLEMVKLLVLNDANVLRPRRRELVKKGFIEEDGKKVCDISGKRVILWKIKS